MALYPTTPRYAEPFDQLVDTFFGNAGRTANGNSLMRAPETDVLETEREIRVITEMPGLKRENIDIDIENNVLTIRGEKREQRTEGEQGRWHLAERRYGTFTRSFVLPRDVDADNIQASFSDGVLTVTVPKSEKARRRRIQIGGEAGQQHLGTDSGMEQPTGQPQRRPGAAGRGGTGGALSAHPAERGRRHGAAGLARFISPSPPLP
ncbi:MAG TPA: Hsp20/alpha crystallin family protein, partial [Longimicrobium sp.]|nr:Hsp20/alpha crystallin family protein [Longimicrobium sp.]